MEIDSNILTYLRKKVIEAFFESTGMNFLPTPSQGNPYYDELSDDIKLRLDMKKGDSAPGASTFIKLFLRPEEVDFDPKTIFILEKYCLICLEDGDIHKSLQLGYDLIDLNFIKKVKSDAVEYNFIDFYLSNQLCQWYGVAKLDHWDIIRKNYPEIKDFIINSFAIKNSLRIPAVITGDGGSGKSTFLRRLAVDCANTSIIVLWVTSLDLFVYSIKNLKKEQKHLIIIEDWEKLKGSPSKNEFLFNSLIKFDNIRLVIGDRDTAQKEYLIWFDEQRTHELTSEENEVIINKILTSNNWSTRSKAIWSDMRLLDIPLYFVLYSIIVDKTVIGN